MRHLLTAAVVLGLAACGGDGGSDFAGVAESDARERAEKKANEVEREDETPVSLVEFRRDRTREGADAWFGVYADRSGRYEDLCVWVNENGTEADDCPGYAGVTHATARIESEREAASRERELEIELEFVALRHGEGEGGEPAWEAVYDDTTGEYPDLCVWVQTDPQNKKKNLITSDECE